MRSQVVSLLFLRTLSGSQPAATTLRFSYARATGDIAEGLRRLAAFMAAR